MSQDMSSRPDLTGEFRVRVPLPIVVPLAAIAVIAVIAFGFSRVLLTISHEAATTVALVTAANILIAGAFIALHPRMHRVGVFEVALIALYPVVIAIVIAATGIGSEATTESAAEGTAAVQEEDGAPGGAAGDVILTAQSMSFDTDEIELPARAEASVTLVNDDTVPHDFGLYASEEDGTSMSDPLFDGDDVAAGASETYTFETPPPGDYYFQCNLHPTMNGTAVVG